MACEHVIFLSIPGLRPADIDPATTPTLYGWANHGAIGELIPTFPCVTSPVQANMRTGLTPDQHGVIANGFYDRDCHEAAFWVAHDDVIAGSQVWDEIREARPDYRSAVWHAQNIKDASADLIITPSPIHKEDGSTKLWCYEKPEGLYEELIDALGHFPLQHYWGPLSGIPSTQWILSAAAWVAREHAPNLQWVYIPHLDYAAQKFGPNSDEARRSLVELDEALKSFAKQIASMPGHAGVIYLVAGEYAMTEVSGVVYPNRLLREAGLLTIREEDDGEHVDLAASAAFAMVDHQLTHIYVADANPKVIAQCAELLRTEPGVAGIYMGRDRGDIGIDHTRSGDLVAITRDDHWFAYYWWLVDSAAPVFAHTVDIHRKPGYDPVELFFDPGTKRIPLDATLVRGSHGVPATKPQHAAAILCSAASNAVESGKRYRDTDVKQITLSLLGLGL